MSPEPSKKRMLGMKAGSEGKGGKRNQQSTCNKFSKNYHLQIADARRPRIDAGRPRIDARRPRINARRPRIDSRRPRIDARRQRLNNQPLTK